MREAYDGGVDNYVYTYVDNLKINCAGALKIYPSLTNELRFLDVIVTIATISDQKDSMPFQTFRSAVLRSTRLIHSLWEDKRKEEQEGARNEQC